MREFFTIAIFKIKADIRMNKTALNSQKEKHSMLSLRRATFVGLAAHRLRNISIHALLAESDLPVFLSGFWAYLFLSTLSLRRATHCIWILCRQHPDFYPRSPCGERRGSSSKSTRCLRISIHALLAESDAWCMSRKTPVQAAFLSTLSLRRATLPETAAVVPSRQFLSTLSLRRATPRTKSTRSRRPYFYPRSPCGERHLHSKRHIRIH